MGCLAVAGRRSLAHRRSQIRGPKTSVGPLAASARWRADRFRRRALQRQGLAGRHPSIPGPIRRSGKLEFDQHQFLQSSRTGQSDSTLGQTEPTRHRPGCLKLFTVMIPIERQRLLDVTGRVFELKFAENRVAGLGQSSCAEQCRGVLGCAYDGPSVYGHQAEYRNKTARFVIGQCALVALGADIDAFVHNFA